jgi:hypothetical protein
MGVHAAPLEEVIEDLALIELLLMRVLLLFNHGVVDGHAIPEGVSYVIGRVRSVRVYLYRLRLH